MAKPKIKNPVAPEDRPDQTHQKVDFATVLRRRRRSARDYVREQGLVGESVLKKHLDELEKTYIISKEFRAACRKGMIGNVVSDAKSKKKTKTARPKVAPKPKPPPRTGRKRG